MKLYVRHILLIPAIPYKGDGIGVRGFLRWVHEALKIPRCWYRQREPLALGPNVRGFTLQWNIGLTGKSYIR